MVRTLKVLSSKETAGAASHELETLLLSDEHLDFLERLCHSMNPEMPPAFGWPHAIRAILDRMEESGIDLTDASSEEEIAQLAAGRLRRDERRLRPTSGSLSVFPRSRLTDRPKYRSILLETDRCHSGRRPRSGHG